MWRGAAIVLAGIATFLIFPVDCGGRSDGRVYCESVAGVVYRPPWVVASLWAALAVALVWFVIRRPRP